MFLEMAKNVNTRETVYRKTILKWFLTIWKGTHLHSEKMEIQIKTEIFTTY